MRQSNHKSNNPKWLPVRGSGIYLALAVAVLIILSGGCSSFIDSEGKNAAEISLAPLSQMPDYVQSAPFNVQEAYRFAVANPEVLEYIPCYCGCGGMGHGNNLDCYVAAFKNDGNVAEFDNHAAY